MSESFNFEYCRCCTCGYEWRKGLNGSHSCAENLQRQLAEAREENSRLKTDVIHDLESMYPYDEDKHTIKDIRDLINKLKEKGDE